MHRRACARVCERVRKRWLLFNCNAAICTPCLLGHKINCPTAKENQSRFDDVIHISQKFRGGKAGRSVGVRAAEAGEEEGGGGRGREEEEEEVMSEMAALHNFFEVEQKESEGKWKVRKRGVCCLCWRR